MTQFKVETVPFTQNFKDQKPGTSGLRKRVKVFQQQQYTESFVQATLTTAIGSGPTKLVIGGDGRFYNKTAIAIIIRLAAANKVSELIIGKDGILSTPAASNLIRKLKATGGILLTASHNPGGPENDFGIKYNVSNGGPAPEGITNKIYQETLSQKSFKTLSNDPLVDISKIGSYLIKTVDEAKNEFEMKVSVIDSCADYVTLMKEIFDFNQIKAFLSSGNFKILFDSMHGVTGPYATRIFQDELGLANSVINNVPSETFNNGHPDPNLTYAHELVEQVEKKKIDLGAASDGDGDRNMIVAFDCFVNPSDSVAVIASHSDSIPYFKKSGLKGVARSMPTSASIDRVAKKKGIPIYQVPTGWKFFGNLMDAGKLSICGEESFGTGSDHIREKDGIWAVLAWLNIIADLNKKEKTSVSNVLTNHWKEFGRNYFTRYDFEEVSSEAGNEMMKHLRNIETTKEWNGKEFAGLNSANQTEKYTVDKVEDFAYTDPIDGSISTKQGVQVLFKDGSRIVYRLSGTGSSGATIRIYIEKYDAVDINKNASDGLSGLVQIALQMGRILELTGRKEPTVIT